MWRFVPNSRAMAGIVALTTATVLAAAPARAATEARQLPAPSTMAAMGDSLSRGYNACGWFFDCVDRSWSTGGSDRVASHYARLVSINPRLDGNGHNNARTGALAAELPDQAARTVEQRADYVTVQIGVADACAATADEMTGVADFRSHVDEALAVLAEGLPNATVLIASMPDLNRLWQIGRTDVDARNTWRLMDVCPALLAAPDSGDTADVARRQRVAEQIISYNDELAAACADYGDRCRTDGGAVYHFPFTLAHLSRWDYLHLNPEGQAVVAEITYRAGWW